MELKKKKNAILEVCGQRGVALVGRLRLPQVAKLKVFFFFFEGNSKLNISADQLLNTTIHTTHIHLLH